MPQISNSQSYHTTCVAPAGIDRPLNDTPPLMSATAALGSTDIDFLGGSQYSPYTNLETIEDIDWVSELLHIILYITPEIGIDSNNGFLDAMGLYAIK